MKRFGLPMFLAVALACAVTARGELFTGLEVADIPSSTAGDTPTKGKGAIVQTVGSPSPSNKSGFQSGDLIYKIGSTWVRAASDVAKWAETANPGAKVPVYLYRRGESGWQRMKLEITPREAQAGDPPAGADDAAPGAPPPPLASDDARRIAALAGATSEDDKRELRTLLMAASRKPELLHVMALVLKHNKDAELRAFAAGQITTGFATVASHAMRKRKLPVDVHLRNALMPYANDPDLSVQRNVERVLRMMDPTRPSKPEPADAPQAVASRDDQSLRSHGLAMQALARQDTPEAMNRVKQYLTDENWMNRVSAAGVLGNLDPEQRATYREALLAASATERHEKVRYALQKALIEIEEHVIGGDPVKL